MTRGALADLRVIDLTDGVAGSFCAKLFADYGADVVKVEPPEGSLLRRKCAGAGNNGALFRWLNTNKRGITLDRARADDQVLFERLAAGSDVLIEDFTAEQRGNDALVRTLLALHPRLIVISITEFGLSGPFAARRGTTLTMNALTGFSRINQVDGEPYPEPSEHIYTQAGIVAWVTALAAIENRARTGTGQRADISVLESGVAVLTPQLVRHFLGFPIARPEKQLLRCKDGYLFILANQTRAWESVQIVLGLTELSEDPRFATVQLRTQNNRLLLEAIEQRAASCTRRELFDALSTLRGVCGMVLEPDELFEDPHLQERGYFRQLTGGSASAQVYPGPPFRGKTTPWRLAREAPTLGQHTSEILGQWLGADVAQMDTAGGAERHPALPARSNAPEAGSNRRHLPGNQAEAPEMESAGGTNAEVHQDDRPPPLVSAASGQAAPAPHRAPLDHVRVIDLSQAWAGAFATQILGDLGAELIKVEARRRPDPWRGGIDAFQHGVGTPGNRPYNRSPLTNSVCRNKLGITLDLGTERGRALLLQVVLTADVVVENFTPRVMKNFGLEFETLVKFRPGLIMLSMPAYGDSGPYSDFPGIGGSLEPMSGNSSLMGTPDGAPVNSGVMYPDPISGLLGAAAVLTALHARDRGEKGQYINLSQHEAMISLLGGVLTAAASGEQIGRQGDADPWVVPSRHYRCRDGRFAAISVTNDQDWLQFIESAGRSDLVSDSRYLTAEARLCHRAEVDEVVERWCAEHDAIRVEQILVHHGPAVGLVREIAEVAACPQLQARDFFRTLRHAELGEFQTAGLPWRLSDTPAVIRRGPPCLGQHSREVLTDLLALTDEDYEELERLGISGDRPPEL
ncbi:MAG: CaiB/BaiF CoA transferase family protein [Dehalococcoidia bacterium]